MTRSGECTRSAYARTLPQITPWVNGCAGVAGDLGEAAVLRRDLEASTPTDSRADTRSACDRDGRLSCARARLARAACIPFTTPEARRLALLFGVVYFAQGMWYLPNQTITIILKERGCSAPGQVADFFADRHDPVAASSRVYGLLSDFVPLFGRRRQELLLLDLRARRRSPASRSR